jgi:hypothetical protein
MKYLILLMFLSSCTLAPKVEEPIKAPKPTAPVTPSKQFKVQMPYSKPVQKPVIAENPLPYPHCMSNAVEFWESVYTSAGSSTFIYNDKTHVVYLVNDDTNWKQRKRIGKHLIHKVVKQHKVDASDVKAQIGASKTFRIGLQRALDLIPVIKNRLKEAGVPEDLAYIPLVESSFNLKAKSPVGALGAWQIMPRTHKLYKGKKANKKLLYDIEYATEVAIIILKHNYELLGSWPLAVNAYHSGPGRLMKAQSSLGTSDICEITSTYEGKGYKTASRSYYAQFLAARNLYQRFISEYLVNNSNPIN